MDQMRFYVDILNTKVVYNFLIFIFLKFHDFRSDGLGVIDFRSLLSVSLDISEWLYCLAHLNMESNIGDNRRVVVLFLSFLKCLRSLLLGGPEL